MSDSNNGHLQLYSAAFTKAAQRRFSPTYSVSQLIRYVADLRRHLGDNANKLNPKVAENLLRYAVGDETFSEDPPFGVSQQLLIREEISLLIALYVDMELDEAEAEEFIKDSVELANHWTSCKNSQPEK
ncbi:hypothetical protein GCM10022254_08010 [Actinomadura meridiana]|uniref:Uncharacterized protein n=1 Tax=Actinomadura meridiana TaxID=559626 RepID=A0ABP8BTR9_9ACTN